MSISLILIHISYPLFILLLFYINFSSIDLYSYKACKGLTICLLSSGTGLGTADGRTHRAPLCIVIEKECRLGRVCYYFNSRDLLQPFIIASITLRNKS